MSRSLRLYFEDILNSCHKVWRYTENSQMCLGDGAIIVKCSRFRGRIIWGTRFKNDFEELNRLVFQKKNGTEG